MICPMGFFVFLIPNAAFTLKMTAFARLFCRCVRLCYAGLCIRSYRNSGAMSAPFGQQSVWNSGWIENALKIAGSLSGSNISPYSSSPKSTSPSVPSAKRTEMTKSCSYRAAMTLGIMILLQWCDFVHRSSCLNKVPVLDKFIVV